ncbi:uncharacterized protein LOC111268057 isoform X2 [Varroa jacobsoni]|uniref:uncharacterized protein LOC111268057 isoform X2 n=1 Tax=Varroa jacobsoni TaxID=62625 RepID=UPI000BF4D6B9|nr:uncharacterized protein LOC111268057 isoform X2 [Varroa jacobsoni]
MLQVALVFVSPVVAEVDKWIDGDPMVVLIERCLLEYRVSRWLASSCEESTPDLLVLMSRVNIVRLTTERVGQRKRICMERPSND